MEAAFGGPKTNYMKNRDYSLSVASRLLAHLDDRYKLIPEAAAQ